MSKQSSLLKAILAAVTAIGLGGSASAAGGANLLQGLKGTLEATTGQVLPAVSNPKPYRQGVSATCNVNSPTLGSDLCIMPLDTVPANHLLQIDNVNCFSSGAVIIFRNNLKIDALHLAGFGAAPNDNVTAAVTHGPYYFNAAETPKLVMSGSSPTAVGICTVDGTLWQTN